MGIKKENFKIYVVAFSAIIAIIGIMSFYKLMRFYVYDEIDYNEWNAETDNKLETDYISNFLLKYQYVNLNGLIENLMGHQEMNGVVKLNNGYLTSKMGYISDETISENADNLYLSQYILDTHGLGIQYLYVTVPYTLDKYTDGMLPAGIEDFGNDNLDRMRAAVEARGIASLDLREEMMEDGYTTYDWFFKTDHHWTTQGGFYAYTKIIEYLEDMCGFEVDEKVKDINNYSVTTYPRWHLGSRGQRTGIYYAGIDDFDLILPEFDTHIYNWYYSKEGTIEEMMIDESPLENKDYTSRYTYDYVYSNTLSNYHNPAASVDKTVLVIGDSMARTVMPYMCLSFTNVLFFSDYSSVYEIGWDYIDEYQPDIIICLYYPERIGEESLYRFCFW